MTAPNSPAGVLATFQRHYKLVVLPTALAGVTALVVSLISPELWQASQGFLIRDEVSGELSQLGRFSDKESLKAAQETITEIAHNDGVIASTLKSVGPAKPKADWPTRDDIETLQDRVSVTAPAGAVFGETEVIYLNVEGESPARAKQLIDVLADELRKRLQRLRNERAQSVVRELATSVKLGKEDLATAIATVHKMEQEVGADLGELRQLIAEGGSDGSLRTTKVQLDAEIRQSQRELLEAQEQLRYLQAAIHDADQPLVIPSKLFKSHSTLQRLIDGLAEAQLKSSRLLGAMTAEHPKVKDALLEESRARRTLKAEIQLAIRSLKAEIQASEVTLKSLRQQLTGVNQRLSKLAQIHSQYRAATDEVKHRTSILETSRRDLTEARSVQAAASTGSLLSPIDDAVIGSQPIGLGALATVGIACLGGLTVGVGLVFLVAPVGQRWGRRWSDFIGGRRATDQERVPGRRTQDQPNTNPTGRRSGDQWAQPTSTAAVPHPLATPEQPSQPAATQSSEPPTAPAHPQTPTKPFSLEQSLQRIQELQDV